MRKKTILFVVGTRPEIIKTASVIALFKKDQRYSVKLMFSGQHQALAAQMIKEFALTVDYDLKLMKPAQSLNYLASRSVKLFEHVLTHCSPDLMMVQGDTTTAFCASLAAFYRKIPVAHIEAGLRTLDKYRPYPEEINRAMISRIADMHFAPTQQAKRNLLREGVPAQSIIVTGNTVIDALLYIIKNKQASYKLPSVVASCEKIVLVTAHRRESFGIPLQHICRALKIIARKHPDLGIVYPVHPNPEVRRIANQELIGLRNIALIEPLGYIDFIKLMERSCIVLTDSGGIQEEAPSLGKPVLILRDKTERPEVVQAGCAKLIGTSTQSIVSACERLLSNKQSYQSMSRKKNPVGDGKAAVRIKRFVDVYMRKIS